MSVMDRFRAIDTDGNGKLDLAEVVAGHELLNVSEERAKKWFAEVDTDGSGEVDMEEFLAKFRDFTETDAFKHLSRATEASKHLHDKATADNTSAAEHISYMRKHERELMSKELTAAKSEWEARDHATVAQDIGHLATDTVASKHRHDKVTADNTPEAEYIAKMRLHQREIMSQQLTLDHDEWQRRSDKMKESGAKRFREVDTDGNGKLDYDEVIAGAKFLHMTEDEAGKWFIEIDKDGSGDIDLEEFLAKYQAYTISHAYVHAAMATESSQANIGPRFKSAKEIDAEKQKNDREAMNEANAKAKEEWQRRREKAAANPRARFEKPPLGHYASETESSEHRHDSKAKAAAKEDFLKTHGRKAIEQANNDAYATYEKRMAKKRSEREKSESVARSESLARGEAPPLAAAPGKPIWKPKTSRTETDDLDVGPSLKEASDVSEKAGAALSRGSAALERARKIMAEREEKDRKREAARAAAVEAGKKAVREARLAEERARNANKKRGVLWFVPDKIAPWRKEADRGSPSKDSAPLSPQRIRQSVESRRAKAVTGSTSLSRESLDAARARLASLRNARLGVVVEESGKASPKRPTSVPPRPPLSPQSLGTSI